MVARREQFEPWFGFVLRNVLNRVRLTLVAVLLICLTASLASGFHTHVAATAAQETDAAASAPKPTGLSAQFTSRHASHTQKPGAAQEGDKPTTGLPLTHSVTHTHDVPLISAEFTVSTADFTLTFGHMLQQRSQLFELPSDIFHPPKPV